MPETEAKPRALEPVPQGAGQGWKAVLKSGKQAIVHEVPVASATAAAAVPRIQRLADHPHPSLSPILAWGTEEDGIWIAVEPNEGTPLSTVLGRGRFTPHAAAALGVSVLSGIAALHEAGIAMGGFDATTVRITGNGAVRLAGHPIAALRGAPSQGDLRADVRSCGMAICAAFGVDPAGAPAPAELSPPLVVTIRSMASGAMGPAVDRAQGALRETAGPLLAPDRQVAAQSELALRAGGREMASFTPFIPGEAQAGPSPRPDEQPPVRRSASYDPPPRAVETYSQTPAIQVPPGPASTPAPPSAPASFESRPPAITTPAPPPFESRPPVPSTPPQSATPAPAPWESRPPVPAAGQPAAGTPPPAAAGQAPAFEIVVPTPAPAPAAPTPAPTPAASTPPVPAATQWGPAPVPEPAYASTPPAPAAPDEAPPTPGEEPQFTATAPQPEPAAPAPVEAAPPPRAPVREPGPSTWKPVETGSWTPGPAVGGVRASEWTGEATPVPQPVAEEFRSSKPVPKAITTVAETRSDTSAPAITRSTSAPARRPAERRPASDVPSGRPGWVVPAAVAVVILLVLGSAGVYFATRGSSTTSHASTSPHPTASAKVSPTPTLSGIQQVPVYAPSAAAPIGSVHFCTTSTPCVAPGLPNATDTNCQLGGPCTYEIGIFYSPTYGGQVSYVLKFFDRCTAQTTDLPGGSATAGNSQFPKFAVSEVGSRVTLPTGAKAAALVAVMQTPSVVQSTPLLLGADTC